MLPYQSADLPAERRVEDLLARMTLEEKAAQMMCVWQQKADKLVDASGDFDSEKARRCIRGRTWYWTGRSSERCGRRKGRPRPGRR